MPLNAGTVVVNPGNSVSGTGLAKALYDLLASATGVTSATAAPAQLQLTQVAQSIASAVVAHIQANALVTVAAGIPVATAGSATAQTGATTAPGTGTVS